MDAEEKVIEAGKKLVGELVRMNHGEPMSEKDLAEIEAELKELLEFGNAILDERAGHNSAPVDVDSMTRMIGGPPYEPKVGDGGEA